MKISILTLFPEMFRGPFDFSIVKRAREKGMVEVEFVNIREFGIGNHKMVDDTPYGGGVGMVMRVDVLHKAIEHAKKNYSSSEALAESRSLTLSKSRSLRLARTISQRVVLLSATGQTFKQKKAQEFSKLDHLILICGHYEGVDERVKSFIDEEVSIGDFVTTGGEIPAMLITDAVVRLIPGVLKTGATTLESFSPQQDSLSPMLEYPQYTKPPEYEGQKVPEILLSGNHKKIDSWRQEEAFRLTQLNRPDLLKKNS